MALTWVVWWREGGTCAHKNKNVTLKLKDTYKRIMSKTYIFSSMKTVLGDQAFSGPTSHKDLIEMLFMISLVIILYK